MTRRPAAQAILLALVAGGAIAAGTLPAASSARPPAVGPRAAAASHTAKGVRQLPPPADRWAIVAGFGAYDDPALSRLHGDQDARDFAQAIEEHAGFSNDHIVLLAGGNARGCRPPRPGQSPEKRESVEAAANDDCAPTLKKLVDELHNVPLEAGLLVFFFSGHGENVDGESVLLPPGLDYSLNLGTDAQASYLKRNGLAGTAFAGILKERHVKQVMIFLDACRTRRGASPEPANRAASAPVNDTFDLAKQGLPLEASLRFYSTSNWSPSYEDPRKRAYFARELVRALDGRNDSYGLHNVLTLQALIDQVRKLVTTRSRADERRRPDTPGQVPETPGQVPESHLDGYLPEVVLAGREAPPGAHPELLSGSPLLMAPDGKRVYLADSRRGAVLVFSTAQGQPAQVIDLRPGTPEQMVMAVRRGRLYVTEPVSQTVVVVDTATLKIVQRMPAGTSPQSLALTPDETKLYVSNQQPAPHGTISVLDPGGSGAIGKPIGGVNCPEGLAMAPDGQRLYVETQCGSGDDPLFVINTRTDLVERTFKGFAVGGVALGMAPNGEKLYVGTEKPDRTQVLITATGDVKPVGRPGHTMARYFAVTPDGKYVLGVGRSTSLAFIDAVTDEVLEPHDLGVQGAGIAIGMVPPTRKDEPPHANCYIWLPDVPQLFFTGLDGLLPPRQDPD
jgi:YVTN family beta-propeller protein